MIDEHKIRHFIDKALAHFIKIIQKRQQYNSFCEDIQSKLFGLIKQFTELRIKESGPYHVFFINILET